MRHVALLAFFVMSGMASAQTQGGIVVDTCDSFVGNARNVDWFDPTRSFANGEIRFITLDVGEPAAAAFHLMVLFPAVDHPFGDCRIISAGPGGLGFERVSLRRADATYDPARGLTVRVPASEASPVHPTPLSIDVTVNQATGTMTARLGPP